MALRFLTGQFRRLGRIVSRLGGRARLRRALRMRGFRWQNARAPGTALRVPQRGKARHGHRNGGGNPARMGGSSRPVEPTAAHSERQRLHEGGAIREASGGVLGQCAQERRIGGIRKSGNRLGEFVLHRGHHHRRIARLEHPSERRGAGQELVNDTCQRILVRAAVLLLPQPLFRSHVGAGAGGIARLGRKAGHGRADFGGESEVNEADADSGLTV